MGWCGCVRYVVSKVGEPHEEREHRGLHLARAQLGGEDEEGLRLHLIEDVDERLLTERKDLVGEAERHVQPAHPYQVHQVGENEQALAQGDDATEPPRLEPRGVQQGAREPGGLGDDCHPRA